MSLSSCFFFIFVLEMGENLNFVDDVVRKED